MSMATDVNNAIAASTKPLNAKIKKLEKAIDKVYERYDDGHHSFHKHYHGGCILCEIEQVLKGKQ